MRGRKPKPTHLKLIEGNPGKRRVNPVEPVPLPELHAPPPFLPQEGQDEWKRVATELYNLGLLTVVDRTALAAYCHSYAIWKQATDAINAMAARDQLTRGLMIKTTNGNAIQNLNETQRVAFLMHRIDGKKYAEIAAELEISVKAVEKRIHLALVELRKEFDHFK